jgi:hypothetical protein
MEAAEKTAEQIETSRKYPWTDYRSPVNLKTCGSNLTNYSVTWYIPTNAPGMHGWRSTTISFETKEQAMAAGERMMGIAFEVIVYEWDWALPHENPGRRKTIYNRKNKNAKRR